MSGIYRYKSQIGVYPNKLQDLVPEFYNELPKLYIGKLSYTDKGDSFEIYIYKHGNTSRGWTYSFNDEKWNYWEWPNN